MKLWSPGQNVDVARFHSGNSGHPSWFHSLRTRANFKNGLRRSRIFLLAPTMIAQIPDARRRLALLAGVVLLLGIMATELALSARRQSQTFDEGVHIFAGYSYWENSNFWVNPEHPPLVKLVATIPLLRMSLRGPASFPEPDFKVSEYAAGSAFLYANDANKILWRTRMAAAAFSIGLALAVFLVAYRMSGPGPAFVALTLLAFEPNLLAHGGLVTTDVGVTFGMFLAIGCFYFYCKRPSMPRLAAVGLAAGLCLGAKHSGVLLFPILLLLALFELLPLRDPVTRRLSPALTTRALRQLASLAVIGLIAVGCLWSLYGFRYAPRLPGLIEHPTLAESARNITPHLAAGVLWVARWHLLPEPYLYGVTSILTKGSTPTVIFGKYYESGRWFYFPAVFIIKSTAAFLILCSLAPLSVAIREKRFRRELVFLVLPVAFYLATAISSGFNYGVRHLLPIYPFLIILVSVAAWNLAQQQRLVAAVIATVVAFHVMSSIRAFPDYIPYANEFWGGPERAHEILADSNVDWAQGLIALKRYIDRRQIKNCWFAYFGSAIVDPAYYGIPCKRLPTAIANHHELTTAVIPPLVDGPVFISATEVSTTYWKAAWVNPYRRLQGVRPTSVIGNSILVYEGKFDTSEVSALTHETLAMHLLLDHKPDQALEEANTAVAVAPNRPLAHMTRSSVLLALGRKSEAQNELGTAHSMVAAIASSQ